MPLTFNQFNSELEKRINDPQLRYMLGMMYEFIVECDKNNDIAAKLLTEQANIMAKFVGMTEVMGRDLRLLRQKHMEDGIEVKSVMNEPEH